VYSDILDSSVLGKVLSTYDEDELKQWGISGFDTVSVEVRGPMKRVFKMKKEITEDFTGILVLTFQSPDGEGASRFVWKDACLQDEDTLYIRYTVLAGGGGHTTVRMPSGNIRHLHIYASVG